MDKIKSTEIVSKIFTIRGIQVMLDFHIAEFFNVETTE
jgi:arabinogalactan endo-1,4-beta-galactosidase